MNISEPASPSLKMSSPALNRTMKSLRGCETTDALERERRFETRLRKQRHREYRGRGDVSRIGERCFRGTAYLEWMPDASPQTAPLGPPPGRLRGRDGVPIIRSFSSTAARFPHLGGLLRRVPAGSSPPGCRSLHRRANGTSRL